jgi:prepilin-type N-terminal cleavage/methylation domain-containing protein
MLNTKQSTINQKGLTLIEMMIALVLGLFVTAVIITVFSTNVRSSTESIKMIRLNQELRGLMTLMTDELKRHGYSSVATEKGFMNKFNYDAADSCLRYAYDTASDGIVNPASDVFAIHFTASTVFWQTSADTDCDSAAAASNQPLTDPNIAEITTLDIDITGSVNTGGVSGLTALTTTTGLSAYEVTITLTGKADLPHSSDAHDPRRTIIETIRIRNDDPKD